MLKVNVNGEENNFFTFRKTRNVNKTGNDEKFPSSEAPP